MKKVILVIGVTVVVAGLAFAGYIGWALYPQSNPQPLPAAHKYPPTWVPLDLLYAGMQTKDSSSGKMRGYLEVSR